MWKRGLAKGDLYLRLLYSGVQIDLRRDHEGCQQQNKPYKFAEGPLDKKPPNLTSARSANPCKSFRLHLTSPCHYPLQHLSADGTPLLSMMTMMMMMIALLWTLQHSHTAIIVPDIEDIPPLKYSIVKVLNSDEVYDQYKLEDIQA